MGTPEATPQPKAEIEGVPEAYETPETGTTTPSPVAPPQGPAAQFKGMSPESIIGVALNAQQNQMGALNKQVSGG